MAPRLMLLGVVLGKVERACLCGRSTQHLASRVVLVLPLGRKARGTTYQALSHETPAGKPCPVGRGQHLRRARGGA